ncbi:MAG: transporter substrate-binding domain-containing protein [Firmicutes bacterium]|nr:transporter substrate-binding domain-containing protein [Bacillota bacterium]
MKKILVPILALLLVIGLVGCGQGGDEEDPVRRYEDIPTALTELANGNIDAVVADSPVVLEYIKNNPAAELEYFGDESFEKEYFGIAMRKEDTDLHELINEGLDKIRENGIYDKIFNKYFGDGTDFTVQESDNRLGVTYNVASDMTYAPFEYLNDEGEPEGFDIDLIKAIAAEMGFEINLMNTAWDGLIPSLLGGTSDLIIAAMTITEERQESVAFSDWYFESTQYIAVKKGSGITKLEDLQGKTVGVQNGTTGDFAITKYFESLNK